MYVLKFNYDNYVTSLIIMTNYTDKLHTNTLILRGTVQSWRLMMVFANSPSAHIAASATIERPVSSIPIIQRRHASLTTQVRSTVGSTIAAVL